MQVELEQNRQYAEIGKATFMEAFQDTPDDMAKATSTDTAPVIETLAKTEFSPKGMQDVMGMDSLKKELIENIIEPVNNPQQAKLDFEEYGKRIPSGILLYGPPGCGKTYIIEALAAETDSKVYVINSGNTGSKYVNQTANNIKNAFDTVFTEGDKSEKPVFIFMDEIDAMTSNRDESSNGEDTKAVATLLKCIESAKAHNTIVIGATNKYDLMDPAIRRRFDMKRYVGLPEQEHREALIRNNLSAKTKGKKILGEDEKIKSIAQSLQGYSSSSINIIANLAALNALDRGRADIDICDFKKAIETTGEEKIDEKPYKPMAKKDKIGFATSFFND